MNTQDTGASTPALRPTPPPMPPSFGDMVESQVKPIVDLGKAVDSGKKNPKERSPLLPIAATIGAALVVFSSLGIYLIKERRLASGKSVTAPVINMPRPAVAPKHQ